MNDTLLAFYSNFGVVVGGISLVCFVITMLKPHLPSNKIKAMDTLLHETGTTLKEAVEEGLLVYEFAQVAEQRLRILKEDARDLRLVTHKITTLGQDCVEFIRGTSIAIGNTCFSLRKLRAEVITSSEERRCRLQEMSWIPTSVPTPPAFSPVTGLGLNLPPATGITRPSSCPPALLVWRSIDQAADGNPFGDSTQIDLNVRTTDVQA